MINAVEFFSLVESTGLILFVGNRDTGLTAELIKLGNEFQKAGHGQALGVFAKFDESDPYSNACFKHIFVNANLGEATGPLLEKLDPAIFNLLLVEQIVDRETADKVLDYSTTKLVIACIWGENFFSAFERFEDWQISPAKLGATLQFICAGDQTLHVTAELRARILSDGHNCASIKKWLRLILRQ